MRIFGRMLAFCATATGVFVAGNFALLLREVLRDPEAWDGGRGVDAFYLALGILGGGALVLALVAIPSFIGVFAGAVSRGTAAWFLTVPGVFGLVAAAGATGALIALQPAGMEFLVPVVAPMAASPLLALIAGLLMRASVRPVPPQPQPTPVYSPPQYAPVPPPPQ
jgi:hypothetical protein